MYRVGTAYNLLVGNDQIYLYIGRKLIELWHTLEEFIQYLKCMI